MDLPLGFTRVSNRLELYALPYEHMSEIVRKSMLAALAKAAPEEVGKHLPTTWRWNARGQSDEDSDRQLRDFMAEVRAHPELKFMVKVDGTSRGRGVSLLSDGIVDESKLRKMKSACIGQTYISRPSLIRGFKWDLRVYILAVVHLDENASEEDNPNISEQSLKTSVYMYNDGFVRRCVEPYDLSHNKRTAHLTNTAINNKFGDLALIRNAISLSERLESMSQAEQNEQAHLFTDVEDYVMALSLKEKEFQEKQQPGSTVDFGSDSSNALLPVTMTLEQAFEQLELRDSSYLPEQIAKARIDLKELCKDVLEASLRHATVCAPLAYKTHTTLLGLDIMFNADLKPFLLEVNALPDMRCYSLEQLRIKKQIIRNAVLCAFPHLAAEELQHLFGNSLSAQEIDELWSKTVNPPSENPCDVALRWRQQQEQHQTTNLTNIKWEQLFSI